MSNDVDAARVEPVVLLPVRVVQIVAVPIAASASNGDYTELIALCEDGSMWLTYRSNGFANVPNDGKWYMMQPPTPPTIGEYWWCGCGTANGFNLATCRVCDRRAGEK